MLLREALHELEAMHSHHYATCGGECPADNIIQRGRAYLASFGMAPIYVGSCQACWDKADKAKRVATAAPTRLDERD